jgi:hypothetical protein
MAEASTFTNVPEYLAGILIGEEDDSQATLDRSKDSVELMNLMCNDQWLARASHFGTAGAMDRHIEYIGSVLLPQAENKLSRMTSKGIMGEAYVQNHWFGETNEEQPHVSQEVPLDQLIEDQQNFVDELKSRMKTAGIIMVTAVREHDLLSSELDQLTYAAIKAKAAHNRSAREAQTATG